MSQSYHYFHQGQVVGVNAPLGADPSEIPGDYEIIIDGKRKAIPSASGALVYMQVKPEDYPQDENTRQRRAGYLTRLSN